MTANQLNYARLLEESRHNTTVEAETARSNRANETETNRANVVRETETQRNNIATLAETSRANKAREAENYRHNVETEWQEQRRNTETYRHNTAVEVETNRANVRNEQLTQERTYLESKDRNTGYDVTKRGQNLQHKAAGWSIDETERHNRASEATEAVKAEGTMLRGKAAMMQAKTAEDKSTSEKFKNYTSGAKSIVDAFATVVGAGYGGIWGAIKPF